MAKRETKLVYDRAPDEFREAYTRAAKPVWTPEEAQHAMAVVRQNPRREAENPLGYIERISVLAGLIEPKDAKITEWP